MQRRTATVFTRGIGTWSDATAASNRASQQYLRKGNCTSEQLPGFAKPSELGGSVLADVKPPQCVIVTDAAAINVGEGDLWMGNLFMRVKYTARSAAITASASRNISSPGAAVMHVDSGARLWATDVTIQGHGDEKTVQALAAQGPVLCSGCSFRDVGGAREAIRMSGATARLQSTIFQRILMNAGKAVVNIEQPGSAMSMQGSTVTDNVNSVHFFQVSDGARVFSDDTSLKVVNLDSGETVQPESLGSVPGSLSFLAPSDGFLTSRQQELSDLPSGAYVALERAESSGGVKNNIGAIAGACCAAIVVVMFLVFLSTRRRRGHSFRRDAWGLPANPVRVPRARQSPPVSSGLPGAIGSQRISASAHLLPGSRTNSLQHPSFVSHSPDVGGGSYGAAAAATVTEHSTPSQTVDGSTGSMHSAHARYMQQYSQVLSRGSSTNVGGGSGGVYIPPHALAPAANMQVLPPGQVMAAPQQGMYYKPMHALSPEASPAEGSQGMYVPVQYMPTMEGGLAVPIGAPAGSGGFTTSAASMGPTTPTGGGEGGTAYRASMDSERPPSMGLKTAPRNSSSGHVVVVAGAAGDQVGAVSPYSSAFLRPPPCTAAYFAAGDGGVGGGGVAAGATPPVGGAAAGAGVVQAQPQVAEAQSTAVRYWGHYGILGEVGPGNSVADGRLPGEAPTNTQGGAGANTLTDTEVGWGTTRDPITTMGNTLVGMVPPQEGAQPDDAMNFVEMQLDSLADAEVLGGFVLLGAQERRRGGQALIQFAKRSRQREEFAIKFFLSRADYDAEVALYSTDCLGTFLPTIHARVDNLDGSLCDANGNPLPPCIVMEQGESLYDRINITLPDKSGICGILINIAKRLRSLHQDGWVHRDLKPGNVLWLTRKQRWTLIDFGLATRAGTEVQPKFTLTYAAPEVVRAFKSGSTCIADPSTDAWALGVMAFELLTGKPAFTKWQGGTDKVYAQLLGDEPLPWEGERLTQDVLDKLIVFKDGVLALLSREPAARPSMQDFATSCEAIFAPRAPSPSPPQSSNQPPNQPPEPPQSSQQPDSYITTI